jgi:hypothetical protein
MQATALDALLSLWPQLNPSQHRRGLTATQALAAGSPDLRERLATVLAALGYPDACATPRTLGGTLRALRGRLDGQGRALERRPGMSGSIWYVVPAASQVAA